MQPPLATYRVQFRPEFTFDDAAALAGYLADLGVSHLYCSPILQAAPGSTHGYDVVDHSRLNAELGGSEGYDRLCQALAAAGLGQVVDIVPNHMATLGGREAWWWDVLENGPSSRWAAAFDIDWDAPEQKLHEKVLLPILGDHYGKVLDAGELRLERQDGSFVIRYHDHVVPVSPRSLDELLAAAAVDAESDELASLATNHGRLPPANATDDASTEERHRDKEVLRSQLSRLLEEQPDVAKAVDAAVTAVNAEPDDLHALLERQNYRLAFWRAAGQELGYRRFFDVPTLVGLRMENRRIFDAAHALVLDLVRDGKADGLRVDHPDGLRDPAGYFHRLDHETGGGAWIVAEKILEPESPVGRETLAPWPIAGTTGYDFLNVVAGLFVDPAGEAPLTDLYEEVTGVGDAWPDLVREGKNVVLRQVLGADVNRLVNLFVSVCERQRRHRDFTRRELHQALWEVMVSLPVYRTYVRPGDEPSEADVAAVTEAVADAARRLPDLDPELFGFLGDLLLLRVPGRPEADFALRFQQTTGPVMAKGVEDTAFYRYNRLVSLNDVGGDPGRFGTSVEELHAHNARIVADWPSTQLATSTHDTKRSEDVRARIGLLSEIPSEWAEAVRRWSAMNARHKADGMPDANAEYLLYQTLVGAWPLDADRAAAYMEKATREAKVHTSWIDPNPAYDDALRRFVGSVLADPAFADDLAGFVGPLIGPGRTVSLAQTLLKLTSPGVPDLYQGTELWDLSLVDPDNRRPVDYDQRRRLLDRVRDASPEEVLSLADEGAPKLWLTRRALAVRRAHPDAFGAEGTYQPLTAAGERAENAVGFVRGDRVAVLVPRLVLGLAGDWKDTTIDLPAGTWVDALVDTEVASEGWVPVGDLVDRFPVALLERR